MQLSFPFQVIDLIANTCLSVYIDVQFGICFPLPFDRLL